MTTHRGIDRFVLCAVLAALLFSTPLAGDWIADLSPWGSDMLEAVCRDPAGVALPVVVVTLCPAAGSSSDCRTATSDDSGRAVFRGVSPGSYLLRASQDGWADTVVGPLGFGADASPKAPREVLVILNPVCFDC